MGKITNTVKHIIIGCSETPAHHDIGLLEIDRMDRQAGKFACGWHVIVRRDGAIEYGRELQQVGSHTRGHNKDSIGICLVGGGDSGRSGIDLYEDEQIEAMEDEIEYLLTLFPGADIIGQGRLIGGISPGFHVEERYAYLDSAQQNEVDTDE
jgi:N-acetylmuramoyl-L-alanine amidase